MAYGECEVWNDIFDGNASCDIAGAVRVPCVIARIPKPQVQNTALYCATGHTVAHRGLDHRGKQCHNVNAHVLKLRIPVDSYLAPLQIHSDDDLVPDKGDKSLALADHHQHVVGAGLDQVIYDAEVLP